MTTIYDFTGIFAPANWSQIGAGSGAAVFNSPTNTELEILEPGFPFYIYTAGLSTSPPTLTSLPKGKLTFTYAFIGSTVWSYSANGTTVTPSAQAEGTISDIQINDGGTFYFAAGTSPPDPSNTLIINGWQFTPSSSEPFTPTYNLPNQARRIRFGAGTGNSAGFMATNNNGS
jgi:hypothetical protein